MMPHSTAPLRASLTRVLAAALLWLGSAHVAAAAGLTVAWNPNTEGNISRYVVSYGTASGAQSETINVSASVTRVRIENLNAGSRYYLVVRAVNNGGQVSGPSSEVNGLASDVLPAAPAGSAQTYYAEGAAGFFDYRVAVLNTAASETWLNVSFLREGALPVARSYSVGAGRRMTISGADVARAERHVVRGRHLGPGHRRQRAHDALAPERRRWRRRRQGAHRAVDDLVSGRRQRRILRHLRPARQPVGDADRGDGRLPARRRRRRPPAVLARRQRPVHDLDEPDSRAASRDRSRPP